jgi:hypothetical protein
VAGAAAFENPFFPATRVISIAGEVLAARQAALENDHQTMAAALRQAAAAEDALPYMEPPYWYGSVRQTLGAQLLKVGDASGAEAAFREDLERLPRNGWSLHGLAAALRAQGKVEAAASVDREFAKAWGRADVSPELTWY